MMAHRATQEARACHAELPAEQLPGNRADDTVEPSAELDGTAALSDAERRVAALASLGYTNREISRRLHVTVSTVEQHLTRVYRKLNVKNRTDLPADFSLYRAGTADEPCLTSAGGSAAGYGTAVTLHGCGHGRGE
jgi:DNA-binding CsgD family transcriptional regulator